MILDNAKFLVLHKTARSLAFLASSSFVGSFHLISVIAEPRVAIPRLAKQTNQRRIGGGSLVVAEAILYLAAYGRVAVRVCRYHTIGCFLV